MDEINLHTVYTLILIYTEYIGNYSSEGALRVKCYYNLAWQKPHETLQPTQYAVMSSKLLSSFFYFLKNSSFNQIYRQMNETKLLNLM